MDNFDANTPQLEVVKKWFDAIFALDVKNAALFLSKDYRYQAFPESPNLPSGAREQYIEKWNGILGGLTKFRVGAQRWRTFFLRLAD
jgi:hypothetical protein